MGGRGRKVRWSFSFILDGGKTGDASGRSSIPVIRS